MLLAVQVYGCAARRDLGPLATPLGRHLREVYELRRERFDAAPRALNGDVRFMCDLESRFRIASGLESRSHYKIFYGRVRSAPVLLLGINPGGAPSNTRPDGLRMLDGRDAASSATFHENGECDLLDCVWRGNDGLLRVLVPLFGGNREAIRTRVVQTNMAFRRSARKRDIDIRHAMEEARPFLNEIIGRVQPRLVLLAGVKLDLFVRDFAVEADVSVPPERDARVNHVVFAVAKARLRSAENEVSVVQIAHASQFGWTYDRYRIADRVRALVDPLAE